MTKPRSVLFLLIIVLIYSCAGDSKKNNESSHTSLKKDTLPKTIKDNSKLSYWEILARDYPLIYGKNIIEKKNLSKPLAKFSRVIKQSAGNIDKIDILLKQIKKSDLALEQRDSLFFMYIEFMETISPAENNLKCWEEKDKILLENKYIPLGYDIQCSEGETMLLPNLYRISKKFGNFISDDLRNYVSIYNLNNSQIFNDAVLLISWKDYSNYILELEDILSSNTNNIYFKYILLLYSEKLDLLLWGTDNSPVIENRKNKQRRLNKEISLVYDNLINDKKHKTGRIISEHKKRLSKTEFGKNFETRWKPSIKEIKSYLSLDM